MQEINKRIKFEAKDYYNRYKEIKHKFNKDRKDLKSKVLHLEYEQKVNAEENAKNNSLYSEFKNNMGFFKKKMGIKEEMEQGIKIPLK